MVLAQVRKAQPPSLVDSIGSPLQDDAASHAPFGVTGCYVITSSDDLPWCLLSCMHHRVSYQAHLNAVPLLVVIAMGQGRLFLRVLQRRLASSPFFFCFFLFFFCFFHQS